MGIDWPSVFGMIENIKAELSVVLPATILQVESAEADDLIASLVMGRNSEPNTMIVSHDKDLGQLQKYPYVSQYDPSKQKKMKIDNPARFLKEHIIRGDAGDGIPNIMSKDDVFVTGGRQRKVMTAKVDIWLDQEPENFCNIEMLRNFYRNKQLIDLSMIPNDLHTMINDKFEGRKKKDRSKLYSYFIEKRLSNLMESINDF